MKINKYIIILISILIIIFLVICITKKNIIKDIKDINLLYKSSEYTIYKADVKMKKVNENYYMFLPSYTNLNNMKLNFKLSNKYKLFLKKDDNEIEIKNNEEFDFTNFYNEKPENSEYSVDIIIKDKKNNICDEENIIFMKSENISSIFINSDNEIKYGREWIEDSKEHNKTATGNMVMLDSSNNIIYDNLLKQIKGRGNTTWTCSAEKKPYQIKLNESTNLINTNNDMEKSKTWLLIANSLDPTLIRNTLAYDLAKELDLEYTPDCKAIDLYYDGDYRGSYLVCEKIEVSESRINIENSDNKINKDNDLDKLGTKIIKNKYGNNFKYVEQLDSTSDVSGGFLIEIDNAYYMNEKNYFRTSSGDYFVVSSPKYASLNEMKYISELFQEIQNAIENNGINPDTGKSIEEYIDIESFTKYILLQEITKNPDAFYSSTYFYKKQGDDKIYAGPAWDFDTCLGTRTFEKFKNYDGISDTNWLGLLLQLQCIKEKSKEFYPQVYEMVSKVLLEDNNNETLRSIDDYVNEIKASREMNDKLWSVETIQEVLTNKQTIFNTYEENIEYMKEFLSKRNEWLNNEIKNWN